MDGGIEQTLPPALRGLPVARVFLDVRDETCVEDGFAVVPGVKSAVEIEMRAVNVQIRQSGHPLQGVQSLWQEYGIGLIHRRHRKRSQHEAIIVHDRDDFLTPLMFVAGIADAIAAFFGNGVGAIAVQDVEIKLAMLRQMPHAGDERLLERAVVSPFREHLEDGRVVDQGGPVGRSGYWHALPLHTRIEDPQDQIENAMIAQFTFRPTAGHRKVREDKCDELRPGELHGNRRRGLALCHMGHPDMASWEA